MKSSCIRSHPRLLLEAEALLEKAFNYKVKISSWRDSWMVAALKNSQIVGIAGVRNEEDRLHVHSICTLPANKAEQYGIGTGCCKKLLSYVVDIFSPFRKPIELRVEQHNVGAVKCYVSCGFVEQSRTGNIITMNYDIHKSKS